MTRLWTCLVTTLAIGATAHAASRCAQDPFAMHCDGSAVLSCEPKTVVDLPVYTKIRQVPTKTPCTGERSICREDQPGFASCYAPQVSCGAIRLPLARPADRPLDENGPRALAVADVNGDGLPDIVVLTSELAIFEGRGHGQFGPRRVLEAQKSSEDDVRGLAVADLDGDGKPEIATVHHGQGLGFRGDAELVLFNSDGHGGYARHTLDVEVKRVEKHPPVAIHRQDGEGTEDIHVERISTRKEDLPLDGNGMLAVRQGSKTVLDFVSGKKRVDVGFDGSGFHTEESQVAEEPSPRGSPTAPSAEVGMQVGSGDLNGDGRDDLVLRSPSRQLLVAPGLADGSHGAPHELKTAASWVDGAAKVVVADVDGDHRPDLVVADGAAYEVVVLPAACLTSP